MGTEDIPFSCGVECCGIESPALVIYEATETQLREAGII